jgi:cyclomaltodextrinase
MNNNKKVNRIPGWVNQSIFYQIFPDRFNNGDKNNDPPNLQPWGATPTNTGFQGGDFKGILRKLDYLQELGVNSLYLNPIFLSPSNHRYNTTDYFAIDPKLGSLDDFKELLQAVHQRSMHLILDGVLNHCGRGFFAFNDILENQNQSPYLDWFHVYHLPLDAYTPGPATDYEGWWQIKSLPKFNTQNPAVRKYLLDVIRFWTEMGIDGWRMDVPNEINDDSFWAEFHQVIREINPDAYLVGEIWQADPRWIGENHFDGLMNYPLREAILNWLNNGWTAQDFSEKLENLWNNCPEEYRHASFNLLGSHDTERIMTMSGGSVSRTLLAYEIIFALPGVPVIYYGDEIGLEGGKDPDCRRAFSWDTAIWKLGLRDAIKGLIELRKKYPIFSEGNFRRIPSFEHQGIAAFRRTFGDDTLLILINPHDTTLDLTIDTASLGWKEGQVINELIQKRKHTCLKDKVQISITGNTAGYYL